MTSFKKTVSLFLIPITLIIASSLPYSLSLDSDQESHLRDLCTNNIRPDQCWNIIKTNSDLFDCNDSRHIAVATFDLASNKGKEILDQLNQLLQDSDNQQLKEKYQTCVNNYNDATDKITMAKNNLESSDCEGVPENIHSALDAFEECRHNFVKEDFDPANVMDRNKEFFMYGQLAMAAAQKIDA